MTYYPKNRIITGLKANPGELSNPDGEDYIGEYYKTFDEKIFSGSPDNPTNIQLTKNDINNNGLTYNKIIPSPKNDIIRLINDKNNMLDLPDPSYFYPIPNNSNYNLGYIIRYFAKQDKINNFKLLEIDKDTYNSINNEDGKYNHNLWKVISLKWLISGPLEDIYIQNVIQNESIINTNKRNIELLSKEFIGIDKYLTNFQEFYKE